MRDLEDSDRERYFTIFLDVKNDVIGCEEAFVGALDRAVVHPREVFKSALTCSAASIVAVHNHPSGDPRPSPEDKSMTQKLYVCGDLLGIKVLDSIIIGHRSFYSFREGRVRVVEESEGEKEKTSRSRKNQLRMAYMRDEDALVEVRKSPRGHLSSPMTSRGWRKRSERTFPRRTGSFVCPYRAVSLGQSQEKDRKIG